MNSIWKNYVCFSETLCKTSTLFISLPQLFWVHPTESLWIVMSSPHITSLLDQPAAILCAGRTYGSVRPCSRCTRAKWLFRPIMLHLPMDFSSSYVSTTTKIQFIHMELVVTVHLLGAGRCSWRVSGWLLQPQRTQVLSNGYIDDFTWPVFPYISHFQLLALV